MDFIAAVYFRLCCLCFASRVGFASFVGFAGVAGFVSFAGFVGFAGLLVSQVSSVSHVSAGFARCGRFRTLRSWLRFASYAALACLGITKRHPELVSQACWLRRFRRFRMFRLVSHVPAGFARCVSQAMRHWPVWDYQTPPKNSECRTALAQVGAFTTPGPCGTNMRSMRNKRMFVSHAVAFEGDAGFISSVCALGVASCHRKWPICYAFNRVECT